MTFDPQADAPSSCNVVMLPNAAAEPVYNPKRRGRYPRNITTIHALRGERIYRRRLAERAHAELIQEGIIVKVFLPTNKNFGRVARVLSVDRHDNTAKVEPIGGPFISRQGELLPEYAIMDIATIEPQAQAAISRMHKR